jgi:hypothetical protein
MNNNEDEILVIVSAFFALILYGIIGFITGYFLNRTIHKNPGLILGKDRLVIKDNLFFLVDNSHCLSVFCGSLWVFFVAFIIWVKIGRNIYNTKLKYEEDRFVSWFV